MASLRQRTLDALELRGMAVRARSVDLGARDSRDPSREELARLFAAGRNLKSRTSFLMLG